MEQLPLLLAYSARGVPSGAKHQLSLDDLYHEMKLPKWWLWEQLQPCFLLRHRRDLNLHEIAWGEVDPNTRPAGPCPRRDPFVPHPVHFCLCRNV